MQSFLYVGHGIKPAGCKSLYVPSWKETLANDKGVAGDRKSERSHQQIWSFDEQKSDIRLIREGNRAMDWERPKFNRNSERVNQA